MRDAFDLDDVGAHVRQHQSANRPGHDMSELYDLHALKGALRLLVHCDRFLSYRPLKTGVSLAAKAAQPRL